MRPLAWLLTTLLASTAAAAATPRTLLSDVTLIDGTGAPPRPHTDVLLAGARIAAVGAHGRVEARGATVVPLGGRFVIPGLIDLHAHVFNHAWDTHGHLRPHWDRQGALEMLRLLLDNGVTTIRDPGAETEAAVTFRDAVAAGRATGPTIFTAGRILNAAHFDVEPFEPVFTVEEVRREIRWQAALGVDAIKVYATLPPPLVRAAAIEAHAHKLPLVAHLQATTWGEAALLGVDCIEHVASWARAALPPDAQAGYGGDMFARVYWAEHFDLDGAEERATIEALEAHDVTVDPTLIQMWTKFFGDVAARSPDVARAPAIYRAGWPSGSFTAGWTAAQYQAAHAAWPRLLARVKQLYDAGIRLTVGTDTPTPWIVPGVSVHEELALLVDAGLPPLAAIRAATANAAHALGKEALLGTVAPGRRADVVVLSRDPSADIHNTRAIERVYHAGALVFTAPPPLAPATPPPTTPPPRRKPARKR